MNDNWKFSDLPYTSPDVEALQARYDALTQRAKDAQGPEELLEVVRQRDALQQEVALCQSIAFIRAFHDVTDEFYQRELAGDHAPTGDAGYAVSVHGHSRESLRCGGG